MRMTLLRIERILNKLLMSRERLYLKPITEIKEEEWLDKHDVMKLLRIGTSSFYRKLKTCGWVEKEIAGRKYYLKSSII
ncbi:hypothetical protein OQX61_20330 [Pedobacter sp. PLR]|uniref:hypothetical protein n=1 Tax=Pedobacter sp. PLR TaxID=2994465 RepID=UPI002247070C|nr:hypothetical protein [Pedobacter sp. PLR]MCX2453630.1 hypothetical protein [Pedobacter sp. PLR]